MMIRRQPVKNQQFERSVRRQIVLDSKVQIHLDDPNALDRQPKHGIKPAGLHDAHGTQFMVAGAYNIIRVQEE